MMEKKCMKMTFPTEADAKKFLREKKRDGHNDTGRKLRAYQCRCGNWHFTSQTKKVSRAVRRRLKKRDERLGLA